MWKSSYANLSQLRRKHAVWLDSKTVIILAVTKKPVGRPTLPYNAKGSRSRRRRAAELAKSHNVSLLIYAASLAARKRKQADPASILKLLSICLEKAKYMRQAIMAPIKKPENCPPTRH